MAVIKDHVHEVDDQGEIVIPSADAALTARVAALEALSDGVYRLAGDGAPVDYTDGTPPATGEGVADIGSEYTDRLTGNKYSNTGTKAQPIWQQLAFAP